MINNYLNSTQVKLELNSGVAVGISNDLWPAKQARNAFKGPRHGGTLSQWLGSGYFEEYFDGGSAMDYEAKDQSKPSKRSLQSPKISVKLRIFRNDRAPGPTEHYD